MEKRTYERMVRVQFPCMGRALDYINDRFDLHVGDLVYVDGKLEGIQGTVVAVGKEPMYQLSAYKKVVDKVDPRVEGQLFLAGSHAVAFDPSVLPYDRLLRWFRGPMEEERLSCCRNYEPFPLERPEQMPAGAAAARRGMEYYEEGMVRYLTLEGTRGRAIVEGSEYYAVEFTYRDGQISDLRCDCLCSDMCKHQVAALRQLRELLRLIRVNYGGYYRENGYFAAVSKIMLFHHAFARRETGRMTFGN